jgi:hypothetical protein
MGQIFLSLKNANLAVIAGQRYVDMSDSAGIQLVILSDIIFQYNV